MEIDWRFANRECKKLDPEREALALDVTRQMAETWMLLTLVVLAEAGAPMRFSRVLEQVEGVSQKSLTKTLRQLERDGLLTRAVFPEIPPRVEYTITTLGTAMLNQVHPLWLGPLRTWRSLRRRDANTTADRRKVLNENPRNRGNGTLSI